MAVGADRAWSAPAAEVVQLRKRSRFAKAAALPISALTLFLVFLLAYGCAGKQEPLPAAEPRPPIDTVDTEDAYATQCRAKICATLQVTRSRFSNGNVSTLLFFSAYDEHGKPIQIPGFPSGFTAIDSEHFVMSPKGTQATLNYSGVSVAWEANDNGRKKTEDGQQLSAAVKGEVGPIVFNPAAPRGPGDSGSAFLTLRKTVSSDPINAPPSPAASEVGSGHLARPPPRPPSHRPRLPPAPPAAARGRAAAPLARLVVRSRPPSWLGWSARGTTCPSPATPQVGALRSSDATTRRGLGLGRC